MLVGKLIMRGWYVWDVVYFDYDYLQKRTAEVVILNFVYTIFRTKANGNKVLPFKLSKINEHSVAWHNSTLIQHNTCSLIGLKNVFLIRLAIFVWWSFIQRAFCRRSFVCSTPSYRINMWSKRTIQWNNYWSLSTVDWFLWFGSTVNGQILFTSEMQSFSISIWESWKILIIKLEPFTCQLNGKIEWFSLKTKNE